MDYDEYKKHLKQSTIKNIDFINNEYEKFIQDYGMVGNGIGRDINTQSRANQILSRILMIESYYDYLSDIPDIPHYTVEQVNGLIQSNKNIFYNLNKFMKETFPNLPNLPEKPLIPDKVPIPEGGKRKRNKRQNCCNFSRGY